ncbi:MAG: hypothetical protein CME65_15605 [Halobacteriovoraceae bacterium]|nr:hypothetical protein [Halobacteriovoraceae bacterium]|tara:strand:- start:1005 stop:2156 length:1152 start_codon:yes stop_codon:yes gene_type:complete
MIYADYNGSAPISTSVTEYLKERFNQGEYSNPNATHELGRKMLFKMEDARRSLARVLGCKSSQITFNSGSSEGISHIFHSILSSEQKKKIIITSEIEHMAIVQACDYYEKRRGFKTETIKTLENGQVDVNHFKSILETHKDNIAMVTVIAANNETGVIQPYQEIGKLCQDNNIIFFSDTTQYIGKTPFKFEDSYMDFAVSSSHKIGALIGSGFIISKNPELLRPFIFGGGQESGHRGGTQNYLGIETMGVAIEDFERNQEWLRKVHELRERFEANMKNKFAQVYIVGESAPRLASTTMIAIPGIPGQAVQAVLETEKVYVTTSSACSDKKAGNRILESMGLDCNISGSVVRVSLCMNSNQALYDRIEEALTNAYNKLIEVYKL